MFKTSLYNICIHISCIFYAQKSWLIEIMLPESCRYIKLTCQMVKRSWKWNIDLFFLISSQNPKSYYPICMYFSLSSELCTISMSFYASFYSVNYFDRHCVLHIKDWCRLEIDRYIGLPIFFLIFKHFTIIGYQVWKKKNDNQYFFFN